MAQIKSATIEGTKDAPELVIRIPMQAATASSSGKTLVVATTNGNQATTLQVKVKGQDLPVIIGLNAYVKP